MKRKSIFRNFFPCLLILISIIFSFTIMEGKGKWIFPSPDNEAVAEVTNIKIPEWSFEKVISDGSYYDEFGNEVGLKTNDDTLVCFKDASDWTGPKIALIFPKGGIEVANSPATIVAVGLGKTSSMYTFASLELPAYYSVKVDSKKVVHPITQIGYNPNQPEGTAYSVFGDSSTNNKLSPFNCDNTFKIVFPPTLTTIGVKAFYDFGFTSYSFTSSNNIESIEDYAFDPNQKPTDSSIKTSHKFVKAKKKCASIIGTKVSHIGKYAFRSCDLTNDNFYEDIIEMSNVSTVDEYAFYNTSLPTLNYTNAKISQISKYCFEKATIYTLNMTGATINTISEYAFSHCQINKVNMQKAKIGKIDGYAFQYLTSTGKITYVDFTDSVITSIGMHAFKREGYDYFGPKPSDLSLENVNFTEYTFTNATIDSFGKYAFSGNVFKDGLNLSSAKIQRIDELCFQGSRANSYANFYLPRSVTYIGCYCFSLFRLYGSTKKIFLHLYGDYVSRFDNDFARDCDWNPEPVTINLIYIK
ncbi:MAG: leucine-rich repeat protein [Bacilli bacterium]